MLKENEKIVDCQVEHYFINNIIVVCANRNGLQIDRSRAEGNSYFEWSEVKSLIETLQSFLSRYEKDKFEMIDYSYSPQREKIDWSKGS